MASLVITLVGPDRPGLVGKVADVVRQHNGNWLESRMSHLADQFAGIVLVEVQQDQAEALVSSLENLADDQLRLVAQLENTAAPPTAEGHLWALSVVGNDRPGIVREVTQVLTSHDVNVEELSTECTDAPHGGGRIFRAQAAVRLPTDLSAQTLQDDLEHVAADLMVDLNSDGSD